MMMMMMMMMMMIVGISTTRCSPLCRYSTIQYRNVLSFKISKELSSAFERTQVKEGNAQFYISESIIIVPIQYNTV